MGQACIKSTVGQGIASLTVATDALSIAASKMHLVFATGVTRDEAIEMLKNALYRIEAGSTAWPLA